MTDLPTEPPVPPSEPPGPAASPPPPPPPSPPPPPPPPAGPPVIAAPYGQPAYGTGYPVAALPPNLSSAGKRFGAFLLDIVLVIVTLGIGWIIWDLIVWQGGQSPAKQLLHMRIVDAVTGLPIDWSRSFLRNFVLYGLLGAIPILGALYRIIGACFVFNPDRRAIWDRMANTFVVDEA
jgi:uncharacterized RDD family membrane protein YckC